MQLIARGRIVGCEHGTTKDGKPWCRTFLQAPAGGRPVEVASMGVLGANGEDVELVVEVRPERSFDTKEFTGRLVCRVVEADNAGY